MGERGENFRWKPRRFFPSSVRAQWQEVGGCSESEAGGVEGLFWWLPLTQGPWKQGPGLRGRWRRRWRLRSREGMMSSRRLGGGGGRGGQWSALVHRSAAAPPHFGFLANLCSLASPCRSDKISFLSNPCGQFLRQMRFNLKFSFPLYEGNFPFSLTDFSFWCECGLRKAGGVRTPDKGQTRAVWDPWLGGRAGWLGGNGVLCSSCS